MQDSPSNKAAPTEKGIAEKPPLATQFEKKAPKGSSSPLKGEGLGQKHPYLVYLILTLALLGFLIFMGYMAIENGWLPDRGIQAPRN